MLKFATLEPPELDIDPYSDAVLLDPYSFFETLRETGPVVRLTRYGVYAVGQHDICKEVLTDFRRFTTTGGVGLADARKPGEDARPLSELLEVDPPLHSGTRSPLQRILSPTVVKGWREIFDREADRLVQEVKGREVDAMRDLAEAFIFSVFPQALGIRFEPAAIRAIGLMMFNQSGPKNALYRAAMDGGLPYLQWLAETCRRENVVPGSVSEALFIAEDEGLLRPGVATNMVRAFVRGGTDSTIAGIGSLINQISADRKVWDRLKLEPEKRKLAFDEAIRIESPFHVTFRTTIEATELAGFQLDADTKIGVFPGAANHDPAVWAQPDCFDLDRKVAGRHLAFGTADHNCIGQMLARAEAEALLGALLRHVDHIEQVSEPVYARINQMRMIETLRLRLL